MHRGKAGNYFWVGGHTKGLKLGALEGALEVGVEEARRYGQYAYANLRANLTLSAAPTRPGPRNSIIAYDLQPSPGPGLPNLRKSQGLST